MTQVYCGMNEPFRKWSEKFTLPYSVVSMGKWDEFQIIYSKDFWNSTFLSWRLPEFLPQTVPILL